MLRSVPQLQKYRFPYMNSYSKMRFGSMSVSVLPAKVVGKLGKDIRLN
jgi:hypothetical protein